MKEKKSYPVTDICIEKEGEVKTGLERIEETDDKTRDGVRERKKDWKGE